MTRSGRSDWLEAAAPAPVLAGDLPEPSLVARLVRADDQLDLLVELYDADVSGGVVTPGPDGLLRLVVGSQHLVERTFATGRTPTAREVVHVAAGPSVLVVVADPPGPNNRRRRSARR